MKRRKHILKHAGGLLAGQAIAQGMPFVRSIILAHFLNRADFGIAALIQTTVGLFDMVSDLNTGTLLIQGKDGDDPLLQETIHTLAVSRAIVLSLMMVALAWPITYLFDLQNARGLFLCLGFVPLLRGAMHSDTSRLQRHMQYWPSILFDALPPLASTAFAWMLVAFWRSSTAMLWILIVQAAAAAIVSQATARRRFRLGWSSTYGRRIVAFGGPLLLNGLLMFGIFQGDRVVLGAQRFFSWYTKDDLGLYSVALSLSFAPTLIFSKAAVSLMLPRLANAQMHIGRFSEIAAAVVEIFALAGGILAIALVIGGGPATILIYGEKYRAAATFIGWLGAAQGVRLMRVGLTLIALSRGDTKNSLQSNLGRGIGIVAMIIVASLGGTLVAIAASGFFGEIVGLATAAWGLWRKHQMAAYFMLMPSFVVFAAIAICGIFAGKWANELGNPQIAIGAFVMAAFAFTLVATLAFRNLRREVRRVFSHK